MILISGATGFVGKTLTAELLTKEIDIIASVRENFPVFPSRIKQINIGDLLTPINWSSALINVEVVIHLAARVHVMNDIAANPLNEFRKVNVEGTLNLARQAAESGVKRFIFLSSIKVNGEHTDGNLKFSPDGDYIPIEPYALSKYEAEQGLLAIAQEMEMEVVIIRAPLVYGPGVQANFASMMKWINKGIPLPLGAAHNQRSLVALDNLVSFICCCMEHPNAANEIFLISDNEDVSTTELLNKIANAFGKRAQLLPVPESLIRFLAKLVGKSDVADRLFGSLQIDNSKARELLDWSPITTMDEQLKKAAEAFLNEKAI